MAILTSGDVDRAIGTATRIALVGTASSAGSAFSQYEKQARAVVTAKAQLKGYSIATNSTNDFVRLLVLGQWYFFAGGMRKGLEVPAAIANAINLLDEVAREKNALPIPGLDADTEDGIGGSKFSVTTEGSTNARVQFFARSKMTTW